MSKISTEKVIAYITQANQLLVFSHPHHPEAGIQVPAGTIQAGESPEEAVLREAYEETGLENLELQAFLGVQEFDITQFGRAEVQRRYFICNITANRRLSGVIMKTIHPREVRNLLSLSFFGSSFPTVSRNSLLVMEHYSHVCKSKTET